MQVRFLAVSILAVGALSLTACNNSSQIIKGAAPSTSSIKAASTHKNNKDSTHPSWSYAGHTGPEYWGDIKDASACSIGQQQSPVDITKVTATKTEIPTINYLKTADLIINDSGHTVVYTPTTQDNTITLNNERYELKQFHYHTPSEHQFGGQNYPAEIHFVHANSAGNLAVVGVMLKQGSANSTLATLLNGSQLSAANKVDFTAHNVDLSALIPAMPTFYHYDGSLTTPPCSEQVQWYVTKQPLELAGDQLAIMTDLYEGNNRPVQPQGSRTVEQISQ
ncbi:carbonic anhydrase family protein [Psychrobacter sp. TAE2020]|uniref:carbonic anhydrase n=1 Tax=Psychrobacter sp. TAE2020 TaxID=2846762 RepID=UPI001C122403|nr:carbonic anhydrase family protein [Psychrobacter sp. TAE2020]MBU5615708.1 carbonic anhydrase family protein [Psychrobacter sp. TAE2020]